MADQLQDVCTIVPAAANDIVESRNSSRKRSEGYLKGQLGEYKEQGQGSSLKSILSW